jgi:predicted methyltransferase|tara:strand:- start:1179 stop:1865 length:687 start_codon:yes stop_codon:yes gene_type:complete
MKVLLSVAVSCLILSTTIREVNVQERGNHGRLFPPEELGALEGPDRDAWQDPERIMDALGITSGTTVADVGAGGGWFTIKLANRVGPKGLVYAEDIQREMIESINRRVNRTNLSNVKTIIGTSNNPQIPTPVDAVLMVDVYGEVEDPVTLLRNVISQLKKGGRIGIIEHRLNGGGPGPPLQDRVAPETIIRAAEAVNLELVTHDDSFRYQYLLIFVENGSNNNSRIGQ